MPCLWPCRIPSFGSTGETPKLQKEEERYLRLTVHPYPTKFLGDIWCHYRYTINVFHFLYYRSLCSWKYMFWGNPLMTVRWLSCWEELFNKDAIRPVVRREDIFGVCGNYVNSERGTTIMMSLLKQLLQSLSISSGVNLRGAVIFPNNRGGVSFFCTTVKFLF